MKGSSGLQQNYSANHSSSKWILCQGHVMFLQNYNLFHSSYGEPCCVLNDRFSLTVLCGVLVCLYMEMSLTLTLNYLEKVSSDEEYFCLDLLVRCRLWPNHEEFNMKISIWTKSCHIILCFPLKHAIIHICINPGMPFWHYIYFFLEHCMTYQGEQKKVQ